jgi:ubiquinone/menaquinone biosynthesis C-methylase UbiE
MLPARLPKRDVPRTYTWIAPTHDLLALLVERRARRLAVEWAAVQSGERILEVGVGTGLSFQQLLRRNPDGFTDGVDVTPAMLRRARRRARATAPGPNWRLQSGDAYDLPFAENTFDLVFSSYVFDLFPEDDFVPVLREWARVLRPGGRLALATMTTPRRWYESGWALLYRLWPPLLGGCRGVRVAPFFEKAGFQRVRRRHVSQLTFPSEVVRGVLPD